jgi:hypothetical protein
MHKRALGRLVGKLGIMTMAIAPTCSLVCAQHPAPSQEATSQSSLNKSLSDLQTQIGDLRTLLLQMRAEIDRAHATNLELTEKLRETQERLEVVDRDFHSTVRPGGVTGSGAESRTPPLERNAVEGVEERLAKLEEDQQLLTGKIDEQYQTKVESASKYRVRLSGIALLNLFANNGTVDSADFPSVAVKRSALDSRGNFGATVRQSEIGLEVFGPQIRGAKISADAQMDFAGGVPDIPNGVNSGFFRLRTATIRLDWARTSIIAGQDPLFISPLSPTSLASLAVPALSYSGNLWAWMPQVRIEHRLDFSENSDLLFQAGVLDSLDGELPQAEYVRLPQAGEKSRQPAYGTRIAWNRRAFGRFFRFGAAGYYSRQNWGFGRNVDAWTGMSDWLVPFAGWLELSGEFYRGRGIGGFGAGFGRSAVWSGSLFDRSTIVRGLDATGGWAQLKFRPSQKYEFNGVYGRDSSQASEVRSFPNAQTYFDPTLVGDRSWIANVLYHPRSDLLFSVEYRRLRTFSITGASENANHINLAVGVLF